jgi:hypothetical protein
MGIFLCGLDLILLSFISWEVVSIMAKMTLEVCSQFSACSRGKLCFVCSFSCCDLALALVVLSDG